MLRTGVGEQIADRAWSGYKHGFAGNATRADRTAADLDFDSPLMRLAAGGTTSPESSGRRLADGISDDARRAAGAAARSGQRSVRKPT
jgi:hypothetical protein